VRGLFEKQALLQETLAWPDVFCSVRADSFGDAEARTRFTPDLVHIERIATAEVLRHGVIGRQGFPF
jgi:hypothetical protein